MKRVVIGMVLAMISGGGAAAHRLDEYLQATLIGVNRDGVEVEVNLTPGVAVLPVVMAAIDRNRDGQISAEEQQAYVAAVLRDLELQVDGRPEPLRLMESHFPPLEGMREGLGTIRLNLRADRAGHELRFENHHLPVVSVYLVNCLGSRDKSLVVGKPERDEAQRSIRFAYSFADKRGSELKPGWLLQSAFWLAVAGTVAFVRLALRRVSQPQIKI